MRRLMRRRQELAQRWDEHQRAQAALEATGVKLEGKADIGLTWNERRWAEQKVAMVLPTAGPLEAARYAEAAAWRELCETLAQSPAVQAELFAMLGGT
jgi:hypothetical protein